MGQDGFFRTGVRGFNKQDVLTYVDGLKAEHAAEVEQMRAQMKDLFDRTQNAYEQLEQARHQLEEDEQKKEQLLSEHTRITAEMEHYKAACEQLREKQVQAEEADKSELQRLREKNALLERKLKENETRAANAKKSADRFEELTTDIGQFLVELHTMGQQYLDDAGRRSEVLIGEAEHDVAALEKQLSDTRLGLQTLRNSLGKQQETATLRLGEMSEQLERSANELKNTAKAAADAATVTDADDKPTEHFFFRSAVDGGAE